MHRFFPGRGRGGNAITRGDACRPRGGLRLALALALLPALPALGPVAAPLQAAPEPTPWGHRVSPDLLDALAASPSGAVEFLVVLEEEADLGPAARIPDKADKGRFVMRSLRAVADRTQPQLVRALEAQGASVRRFWLANYLCVRGAEDAVLAAARDPRVRRVVTNPRGSVARPLAPIESPVLATAGNGVEWSVAMVGAPVLWNAGFTGEGIVIGSVDTGVDWTHPAIRNRYRGWNGSSATHSTNWHDAVHALSQGDCPPDSPEPCDDDGHGTHTVGTMVGDDGGDNRIGVAPGARWIACRCWEPDRRTDVTYLTECLQWMMAPTDSTGENPDPSLAPHIINNSWICEPVEGCVDPDVLRPLFENLRAAGIVAVASAGNNGPRCNTIYLPPAIYDASLTVGAVDREGIVTSFSSRGAVDIDGSLRTKPDLMAPGDNVRSCIPGDRYISWSGTSMAGPHVAGLVALLFTVDPMLIGNVDAVEAVLRDTAVFQFTNQNCAPRTGTDTPNNTYGHGRVDGEAAMQQLLGTPVRETPPPPEPGGMLSLEVPSPNPVGGRTVVRYSLEAGGPVRLRILDIAGRAVRVLRDERQGPPGEGVAVWDGTGDDGRSVASGIYFIRLETDRGRLTRRVAIAR